MPYCKNHPERQGVGVCMRCQAVVCPECRTQLAGINHCPECLRELGQKRLRKPKRSTISAGLVVAAMAAALWWLLHMAQGRLQ